MGPGGLCPTLTPPPSLRAATRLAGSGPSQTCVLPPLSIPCTVPHPTDPYHPGRGERVEKDSGVVFGVALCLCVCKVSVCLCLCACVCVCVWACSIVSLILERASNSGPCHSFASKIGTKRPAPALFWGGRANWRVARRCFAPFSAATGANAPTPTREPLTPGSRARSADPFRSRESRRPSVPVSRCALRCGRTTARQGWPGGLARTEAQKQAGGLGTGIEYFSDYI